MGWWRSGPSTSRREIRDKASPDVAFRCRVSGLAAPAPTACARLSLETSRPLERRPGNGPNLLYWRQRYGRRAGVPAGCPGFRPAPPTAHRPFEHAAPPIHSLSRSSVDAGSLEPGTSGPSPRPIATGPWPSKRTDWPHGPSRCPFDSASSGTGRSRRTGRRPRTVLRRKDRSLGACSSRRA